MKRCEMTGGCHGTVYRMIRKNMWLKSSNVTGHRVFDRDCILLCTHHRITLKYTRPRFISHPFYRKFAGCSCYKKALLKSRR